MIKVLCLDDDNHSPSYVTKDKVYYDLNYFIKGECLLKSHHCEYEIKQICLVDPPEAFAEMSEEGFMIMFDLVSCDPKDLSEEKRRSRDITFDVLWNNGEEWNRV